ncbi:DUF2182 domain-containing protein [Natrinema salsiterrestre]|uniref:DUF2182 domain-containing protein n=1 Tax=Natrinema salsiterrestre TaxID=2950540 RepID=A0A9Q4KYP3_9EURY|nr:DUF2182 domain-containing protein [Natrinema salsiterrestre]MDF9746470.1 DUF2182 domain-containing protein [Natrinema salsiterrestre]
MRTRESLRDRFSHRPTSVVALVTYVIALFAWIAVIEHWVPTPGSTHGLGLSDPGAPEAIALSNGVTGILLYLCMWGTMMIAMMYPSSVPLFQLYYGTLEGTTKTGRAARMAAFMGMYALVWSLTGIVPLAINVAIPVAAIASEQGGLLWGGALLLLAAYQLSPYKYRCLRYCRSPLGFLMSHHRTGVRGALRMSWQFSVFCVGCCWALFAFMVVVGSMNIVWMALIAIVLSLERTVTWGTSLAYAVGIIAGVAGTGLVAITIV